MMYLEPIKEVIDRLRADAISFRKYGLNGAAEILDHAMTEMSAAVRSALSIAEWLTTQEAAAETGKSVSTIQYWCRNAERFGLRMRRDPGGGYLIHRDSLLRYIGKKDDDVGEAAA